MRPQMSGMTPRVSKPKGGLVLVVMVKGGEYEIG